MNLENLITQMTIGMRNLMTDEMAEIKISHHFNRVSQRYDMLLSSSEMKDPYVLLSFDDMEGVYDFYEHLGVLAGAFNLILNTKGSL